MFFITIFLVYTSLDPSENEKKKENKKISNKEEKRKKRLEKKNKKRLENKNKNKRNKKEKLNKQQSQTKSFIMGYKTTK